VNFRSLTRIIPCAAEEARGRPLVGETRVGTRTPYVDQLREGRVDGADFDDVYPVQARALSSTFWTPVRVAARAAELLVRDASTRVLDVGSGAGKFCIVGAANTGAVFVGVEHRQHLVDVARTAAAYVGVTSARFVHGTFETVDISTFKAIYLFNPFEENIWDRRSRIDDTVELSRERFLADVERTERLLASARVGTRVVTYSGFGGRMPPSYCLLLQEPCHTGQLDLWIRGDDPVPRPRYSASERPWDAPAEGSA